VGTNPAEHVPGALTPVTIPAPTQSTIKVITGGGSAASVGLTGNVSLAGSYAIGGVMAVGNMAVVASSGIGGATTTLTAGALMLSSGGAITAGTVDVLDGTLSLADDTMLATAGSITLGIASGVNVPYAEGYTFTSEASGAISLGSGATLSTAGGLSVNSGSLTDAGGVVNIGSTLTVGTEQTSSLPSAFSADGQVTVTAGGTLTVNGGITASNGSVFAGGVGSKLVASSTLTAAGDGLAPIAGSPARNCVAAADGGFVQLDGLVLNAPPPGFSDPDCPGVSVDGTSRIEIGTAGGTAAGVITIDAGKTITVNTTTFLSGNLVDNGILAIASGTLTQMMGGVSGNGIVQIGKNATWVLNGDIDATDTIAFLDTGAALSIGTSFGSAAPYAVKATITGFRAGDSIILAQPLSTATHTAGIGANPGTLVLRRGTSVVETLRLIGDFTGNSFSISQANDSGATVSLLNQPAPHPIAAPGTPDLLAASDSGVSNSDNLTNVSRPTFTGVGETGNTVTLHHGSTTIGTGTVTNGAWSITATAALAEGVNAITATQKDAAGDVSASSPALNVLLDSRPPVVMAVASSPSNAILGAGMHVSLGLGLSEPVTIAGGTPTLTLNNGGTATFAFGSGTSALMFDYTVAGGQDVPDLAITGVSLNGATVTDQAGNAANLAGAAVNPAGTLATEPSAIAAFDTTAGQPVGVAGEAYTGPVADLQSEYINITSDNLSVATGTPNWFIHSGSGDDAIVVSGVINVLDGGTGSNFLTGGNRTDTFFVDDRVATADIWSTVVGFHAGDAATIWGVTPQDFGLAWVDGQGAAGFTGLTLHATEAGKPTASLTLAGYSHADLGNGRLSVLFGADPASGSAYMYVHGNS
jgi:hypothetical protein